jgi:parallel beta-helix repeat protein
VPKLRIRVVWAAMLCLGLACQNALSAGADLPQAATKMCSSASALEVKGTVRLQPDCIYTMTVSITQSRSELDCQGSVIDSSALKGYGILVNSNGQPLSEVTIRNCVIRNTNGIGIVIAWRQPDRTKVEAMSRDELYRHSPTRVQVSNTLVENAKGAGIFVDDYASEVTLSHVTIRRSQSMAVYLEHSTRNITIEDSLFEENSTGAHREAIAIDSSANNILRGNTFRRNKAGGVFLYKNCGERAHTDPNQVVRWQGADHNVIDGNLFEDEPVGVWIAARQSLDLRALDCMDEYYGGRYARDRAQHNIVSNNTFRDNGRGVVVEDDHNVVSSNRFERMGEVCVRVGTPYRARFLGLPVRDVTVENNACALQHGEGGGIEFLHGSKP